MSQPVFLTRFVLPQEDLLVGKMKANLKKIFKKISKAIGWFFESKNRWVNVLACAIIVIPYTIISFLRLGSDSAPQTFFTQNYYDDITFNFPKDTDIDTMVFYDGVTQGDFTLDIDISYEYTSPSCEKTEEFENGKMVEKTTGECNSLIEKTDTINFKGEGAFKWNKLAVAKDNVSKIVIKNTSDRELDFGQFSFTHKFKYVIPSSISASGINIYSSNDEFSTNENFDGSNPIQNLVDEQETTPRYVTFDNSTYFDEVYFAQTAYQFIHGKVGYENVHPPLGKLIQAIPILLFGRMTPFTWRFAGNVFGILILIVMFALALELFGKRKYAFIATLILSLETFHFAHTRIGTVDTYLVFFTMLAFYFILKFIKRKGLMEIVSERSFRFRRKSIIKKDTNNFFVVIAKTFWDDIYFILSGICFGAAVSTKISGLFGGIALLIIYIIYLIKSKESFAKWMFRGLLYFVCIPIAIYICSFTAFPATTRAAEPRDVVEQTEMLYQYHSTLVATHPYSSPWYTWPLTIKPILYAYDVVGNSTGRILATGNPAIFWTAAVAMVILLYYVFIKHEKRAIFILVAFLSLWIPYAFITRIMFLYHFFPASIFYILGLVYFFFAHDQNKIIGRIILPLLIAVIFFTFVFYYPTISGLLV